MRLKMILLTGIVLAGSFLAPSPGRLEAASPARTVAVEGLMAGLPEAKLLASFRLRESFQALAGKFAAEVASSSRATEAAGEVPTLRIGLGEGGPLPPSLSFLEEFATYRRELAAKAPRAAIPARRNLRRLLEFSRERSLVPDTLYVILNPPEDYALFLTGTVDPKRWRELFSPDRIMNRPTGFAVANTADRRPNPPLLHIGQGFLLVCPANLEGTILDAMLSGQALPPQKFETFVKMASRRPVLAMQADLTGLFEGLGPDWNRDHPLPEALRQVRVFRLIAEPAIVKAQFYTEHDPARVQLGELGKHLAESLRRSLLAVPRLPDDPLRILADSLKATFQGKSVFLEGAGLGATAADVSNAQFAILAWLAGGGALSQE